MGKRKKYGLFVLALVVVVLAVGLGCAEMVQRGMGHWIELFNGATWPTAFSPVVGEPSPYGFWFYAVLTFRTLINLGIVLSGIVALCWLVGGGLRRLIMRQIETLSSMRTTALVTEILKVLEEAEIYPPQEVEDRMFAAARSFDKTELGRKFADAIAEVRGEKA